MIYNPLFDHKKKKIKEEGDDRGTIHVLQVCLAIRAKGSSTYIQSDRHGCGLLIAEKDLCHVKILSD